MYNRGFRSAKGPGACASGHAAVLMSYTCTWWTAVKIFKMKCPFQRTSLIRTKSTKIKHNTLDDQNETFRAQIITIQTRRVMTQDEPDQRLSVMASPAATAMVHRVRACCSWRVLIESMSIADIVFGYANPFIDISLWSKSSKIYPVSSKFSIKNKQLL